MAGVWRSVVRILPVLASRADWLLAGAFTVSAELEVLMRQPQPPGEWRLEAIAALALLGLAWRRRQALVPGALIPTAMPAAIDLLLPKPPVPILSGIAWYAIFVTGAPVFIGRLVRSRSRLVQRLEQQRAALVAERDAGTSRAVIAERQLMSRQLRGG